MLTGEKKRAEALISDTQFELTAKSIGLLEMYCIKYLPTSYVLRGHPQRRQTTRLCAGPACWPWSGDSYTHQQSKTDSVPQSLSPGTLLTSWFHDANQSFIRKNVLTEWQEHLRKVYSFWTDTTYCFEWNKTQTPFNFLFGCHGLLTTGLAAGWMERCECDILQNLVFADWVDLCHGKEASYLLYVLLTFLSVPGCPS